MVFLTAGMGGGTGTGSIPVAAKIARSIGAVTIAVVTMPFSFEMGRRQRNASEGIKRLSPNTDTLIAIPNTDCLHVARRDLPLDTAFRLADDVLRQAVQGITELYHYTRDDQCRLCQCPQLDETRWRGINANRTGRG